jgi:Zn-dependent peptidase ImmA (M78 family)/DNA-binding XRE family transcriptional regulator
MIRRIIGERIKEQREKFGLSIEELAKQIGGISRQTLSKIEKGEAIIDAEKLMIIADITRKPLSYFYAETAPEVRLFFRADNAQGISDELSSKFQKKYQQYGEIEEILGIDRPTSIPLSYGIRSFEKNKKRIADIASKERIRLGAGEAPINNIFELLEQNGIRILFFKSALRDVYGLSTYEAEKGACIFVNSSDDITVERRIFTAAHEYAHLIFHRDEFDQVESFRYRKGRGKAKPGTEKIADHFAGHFLVPTITLEKSIPNKKHITVNDIISLKKLFGVSFEAMIWRLRDERFITGQEHQDFYRFLGRFGYRKKEPDRMKDIFSKNVRYITLVRNAYDNEQITLSKAAELLDLSVVRAREKMQEWSHHS